MTHTVCEPCNDCKYTDCCVVCPVECFYQDDMMLYIDPGDCIDCEACVPECPVEAIYAEANLPAQWASYIQLNKEKCDALKGAAGGHITEKQDAKEGPACNNHEPHADEYDWKSGMVAIDAWSTMARQACKRCHPGLW